MARTIGGKYKLGDVLGVGGMSTVYAATHRNGLAVAIKILHREMADDPGTRKWFLREAYLANQVNHRGAVRILDDEVTEDGLAYLVIERLYGDTLRAIAERNAGKLSAQNVVVLAYDVLDILGAAHARRIVHRDVKPENIFLTDEGDVKMLDFGIAHPLPIIGEKAALATLRLAGTPAFMAPEQARGGEVRPETDIWATGATMFALVAGEHVHANVASTDLLTWTANHPARAVESVAHELPSAVAAVINRALAFEPEQRFASAAAMRDALGEAFATSFGARITDARGGILAQLRGHESIATQRPRQPEMHSLATRPPPRSAPTDRIAVTRTSAGDASARDGRGLDERRRVWPLPVMAAGVSLLALAAGLLYQRQDRRESASIASPAPPRAINREALAALESGIGSWHDGRRSALREFEQATRLDPAFAAAHLAAAVSPPWPPEDEERAHFREALRYRSALSEPDQALLDAAEPLMRVPVNTTETRRRVEALALRYPNDFRFSAFLAHTLLMMNDASGVVRTAENALRSDATAGVMWNLKALGQSMSDSNAAARESWASCLSKAKMPTDCMVFLGLFESNDGECARAEQLAQAALAAGEKASIVFVMLADAVYGRTGNPDALEAIVRRAATDAEPPLPADHNIELQIDIAILRDDFDKAVRLLADYAAAGARSDSVYVRGSAAEAQLIVYGELNRLDEVRAVGKKYLPEMRALNSDPGFDLSQIIESRMYALGLVDRADYVHFRETSLNRQQGVAYGSVAFEWIPIYAKAVRTVDDAREALEALPQYLPLPDLTYRSVYRDEAIGSTYLKAGRRSEALQFLRHGVRSCSRAEYPVSYLHAARNLGAALEEEGDTAGACDAYRQILGTWRPGSQSITAKAAIARATALHCAPSGAHWR